MHGVLLSRIASYNGVSVNTTRCWSIAVHKERVLQLVEAFPEEVDVDALMEKLYLLQKIETAERELARGEGVPDEEVEDRLARWLK
jgi:hypothetical protein